jgi:hypothetical protein
LGGVGGSIIDTTRGLAGLAFNDAVATHKAALSSNLVTWKAAHAADILTTRTDIAALHAAIKASHAH